MRSNEEIKELEKRFLQHKLKARKALKEMKIAKEKFEGLPY